MSLELNPVPLCDVHFKPMAVHVLQSSGERWHVYGCDEASCYRHFASFGYFNLDQAGRAGTPDAGHPRCSFDKMPMYIGKKEPTRLIYFCVQRHPPNRPKAKEVPIG
jgi:hypothetical protein